MLAVIEKVKGGYIASFERLLHHSVEKVWSALTENGKIEKWMPNLQVTDLRKGGNIKFNMNDESGSGFDIKITDLQQNTVLEYEWGEGWVRFELSLKAEGCLLLLKEFVPSLSAHTSKDLSGWHICLDVLTALLNGIYMDFPMDEWERVYEKYRITVDQIER